MFVDFHSHILPAIDDGAKDLNMSLAMLELLKKQGVEIVAATPHFYPHKQSLDDFLHNRQQALDQLKNHRPDEVPAIVPAAEVYLERGIRNLDLRALCYQGSDYLLVELPYTSYQSWFLEEVYSFCLNQSLSPIFAHLDRYLTMYPPDAIREILDFGDAIIQINHEALFENQSRKTVLKWIKDTIPVVFGSDCHNLGNRCSRDSQAQSVIQSKLGNQWLAAYNHYTQSFFKL